MSFHDSDVSILNTVALFSERVRDAGATERLNSESKPINERGGFYEILIDLSTGFPAGNGIYEIATGGYGLYFAIQGSTPGASLNVTFNTGAGNQITNFRPGAFYKGPFGRIVLTKASDCITSGSVRLLLLKEEDVDYQEFFSPSAGTVFGSAVNGASGAATQGTGVASRGANAPVLATDGVTMNGVAGFRVSVRSPGGVQTITAGSIRVWWYDPTAGAWGRGPIVEVLDTGGVVAVTSEYQTNVPVGRLYVEAVGVTLSAAGPTVIVQVTTFG
jgi:hypothetical protein